MRLASALLATVFVFLQAGIAYADGQDAGPTPSGLPVPRFVSLKSDEVNVRTGPGTRYPISYVYKREGMPVEVVDEFDQWRKVKDFEGAAGWVHKSMLDGRRMAMVKAKEAETLHVDDDAKSRPVLRVAPKVIAGIVSCTKEWCRLSIESKKGWIKKSLLWGVYKDEVF